MADTKISALTAKGTPVSADITNILDSGASNADKQITLDDIPLSGNTELKALTTGLVKNTTTTGALSIASVGTDYAPARALQGAASSATPTPAAVAGGADVQYTLTALAEAAAFDISGSWTNGQKLVFRILDNGTARDLDFTTSTNFVPVGVILPTTTVISKLLYVACVYNSITSKMDVIGVNQEQ